jgi:hypothetical protein
MKTYSQFQGIVSVIMIFCIIIEATGCYSTRALTTSEIIESDQYLIHTKESIYSAYDITISDEILSGKLDFNARNLTDSRYTHIYLFSDSLLTINNNQFSLPVGSIKEIKQRVRDQKRTKTLVTALIVGAGIGIVAVVTYGIIGIIQIFRTPVPDPDQTCQDMQDMELCGTGSPH